MKPLPFHLEQVVYLRCDTDTAGIVTGIVQRPRGVIKYLVSWCDPQEEQEHWECELTETKSFEGVPGDTA